MLCQVLLAAAALVTFATSVTATPLPITPAPSPAALFKREAAACNVYVADTQDVVNCANYLTGLGDQACTANGPGSTSTVCSMGTAAVVILNGETTGPGSGPISWPW